MHKIILFLLIFSNISVYGMFQITPKQYVHYKKEGHGRTTIYDIPAELIICYMFTKNQQLNEFATLIKQFKSKKHLNSRLIKSILKNMLPLINLSQTSKHFYTLLNLNQEIERRLLLNYVSPNAIFSYFTYNGCFSESIFYLNVTHYNLLLTIELVRHKGSPKKLQIYDKKFYAKLYTLCNKIENKYNDETFKNACMELKKECNLMTTISGNYINILTDTLSYNDDCLKAFNKLHKYTKLICPTTLKFDFYSDTNNEIIKNIKTSFLDNENLFTILLKNVSVPENILKYAKAYNSFLQTLPPITLVTTQSEEQLIFTTTCGFSNESIIPINIFCDKYLNI